MLINADLTSAIKRKFRSRADCAAAAALPEPRLASIITHHVLPTKDEAERLAKVLHSTTEALGLEYSDPEAEARAKAMAAAVAAAPTAPPVAAQEEVPAAVEPTKDAPKPEAQSKTGFFGKRKK